MDFGPALREYIRSRPLLEVPGMSKISSRPRSASVSLLALLIVSFVLPAADAATCASQTSGMVSWWGADNNALDLIGTNHGSLTNGATYRAGKVGQAFSFDSSLDQGVTIPSSAELNPTEAITMA